MSFDRVTLESFEEVDAQERLESAEFKRGFEAGAASVIASQEVATGKAIEDLSATLNDMNFGFEEARVHLISRLKPLLSQLGETALPLLVQESFGAHLNQVIEQHFATVSNGPLTIGVSAEVAAHLSATYGVDSERFVFVSDSEVEPGQAIIKDNVNQILLDLPALVDSLRSALAGLATPIRTKKNG